MTGSFQTLDSIGRKTLADSILEKVNEVLNGGELTVDQVVEKVSGELGTAPDQVRFAIIAGRSRGELAPRLHEDGSRYLAKVS